MTNVLRDARIGLRLLWKNPGFTSVAVLTLALGIAANTAIFSVIYATFFAPLPYRDADRVVMIWSQRQDGRSMVAPRDFVEWKRRATVFDDVNAWTARTVSLSTGGAPEQIQAAPATPGFLPMLGYGHPLALGRDFLEEEGSPGKDQAVILTHRLWRDRFGADPGIIGRTIRIDRKPYTVVGVLGPGPADENQNKLWMPLAFTSDELNSEGRWLLVMARLKAGVTLEQANANMAAVSRSIPQRHELSAHQSTVSVEPFRNDFLSADTKRGLWLLLGAVGFVLLIACANVANLLLARGTARQRELAIRSSLGALRTRIVGQLLVESLVLAIPGGALGIVLASGLLEIVIALMPPYMLPTEAEVRLNIPVLLFTLAACGLSAILFGAAPAWQAARANVNDTLKESARSVAGGSRRLRHVLVIAEFALALTLLAGGGLAIKSLLALTNRDLGFQMDRLLTFWLPLDREQIKTPEQIEAVYRQLLDRVQALPGVLSASVSTGMPLRPWDDIPFSVAGLPVSEPSQRPSAEINVVSPAYFDTFGIRITRGRTFTEQDRTGSVPVAIVNETFVKRYLPNGDPLAARLVFEPPRPGTATPGAKVEAQIVGVHANVASADSADESAAVDLPFWQNPWGRVRMAVRTAGDPQSVQQSIAALVQSIDPDLPMADVKTMQRVVSESLVRDRFNTVLFGSFAVVGLLLAAFGIYGVMSFAVAQRTHEIGLRMALGAARADIVTRIVGEGMITAAIGTALGSAGAFYVTRSMRGIVTGVTDFDSAAFVAVTMTLLCAALVACVVPAARAASVDPMTALRQE